jgi:hypothetical protein
MIDDYQPKESLLDGYFSCETTEDLYEPTDDELLYPSRHYDWVYVKSPKNEMEDDWKCVNGMWIPF